MRSNSLGQTHWKNFYLRITFAHCLLTQLIKITSDTLKTEKIPFQLTWGKADSRTLDRASWYRNAPRYFPFLFKFQSAVSDICSRKAGEKRTEYIMIFTLTYAREVLVHDSRSAAFSWKSMNKFWKIKSLFLKVWLTREGISKGRL